MSERRRSEGRSVIRSLETYPSTTYCWASQNMFSQDITVACARQVTRRRFIVLNYSGVNTYRRTNKSIEQTVMYDASVQVMLLGRNP